MKNAYPVMLTPDREDGGYLVYVPDFDIYTEGEDIPDAIDMAADAIGLMGIVKEDDGESLPMPSNISMIHPNEDDAIVTLVNVDFTEYRIKNDHRSVKKDCTLPSWLEHQARMAGIDFSDALQTGLKQALGIS